MNTKKLLLTLLISLLFSLPLSSAFSDDGPVFQMDSAPLETDDGEKEEEGEDLSDFRFFVDGRYGYRLPEDSKQKRSSLGELRLHGDYSKDFDWVKIGASADLLGDFVRDDFQRTDLREGIGLIDLRELNASFTPFQFIDLKIGRQILTWGTGDLIFINDLFPKDWRSFFLGRDLTYLKAPSDAIKASFYSSFVNLDLIYTPFFNTDRHIDGQKISYYSPLLGKKVGRKTSFKKEKNESGEIALRAEKKIGANELALYGYYGYWKMPMGVNKLGKYYYPELSVYGASLRRPLFTGMANIEFGYYDSREDSKGTNPLVPNSEIRVLAGYEQEIVKNTTGGVQYYLESMQKYKAYKQYHQGKLKEENRQMMTFKIRREYLRQTLASTIMVFWGLDDKDGHIRLDLDYKATDKLKLILGGLYWFGEQEHTFWGQFEDNSSVYTGVTYYL